MGNPVKYEVIAIFCAPAPGFYWKLKGDYPSNGPFSTKNAAKTAAVEHFEEIKRKVLSGGIR